MDRRRFLSIPPAVAACAADPPAAGELVFDGARPGRPVRPLHGVNGGPLAVGGTLDLSVRWKEAAFPLARLHDCHWPNPDVVDVHAVFPNPAADPDRPESYDFERTDELVSAVVAAGARVVFRLGESIEHQTVKRRARPPRDPARWAAACVGIARHYTAGWAGGFRHPIRYWEVWNEPDNRPACWTGTDDEFLRLYSLTAKALKAALPTLLVGGPGFGNSGRLDGTRLEPPPFVAKFLAHCRADSAPLDFLSWHCYTNDPGELARRGAGVRAVLDAAGFRAAESHLNEWNHLPGNDWGGLLSRDAEERERWYARVGGAEGAAFAAAALCRLQDAPVDAANYFTAEPGGMGLFGQHGVPTATYGAFRAFARVAGLAARLPLVGETPTGVAALAAASAEKGEAAVLVARHAGRGGPVSLRVAPAPWPGPTSYEAFAVGERGRLDRVAGGAAGAGAWRVTTEVGGPGVALVVFRGGG